MKAVRRSCARARAGSRAFSGFGLLLASADASFGRAGGGGHAGASHSFATSQSSDGGYHGYLGGGSFGDLIGLIVVAVIVWYVYRRFTQGRPSLQTFAPMPGAREALGAGLGAAFGAATGRAVGAGRAQNMAGLPGADLQRAGLPAAVDAIRAHDPGFEIETFLQRAEMTFFLVKRGIQKNDLGAIRPYLDDRVFAAVAQNVKAMAAQHQHGLLESLNVRAAHLLDAACDETKQSLQVHFDLVYRAKTLNDANQVLADEGEDTRHGERWTFMRAAAARTPAAGGVTASLCPACGAELRLSLEGICTHCKASVTNGTVDWVVADVQPAPFLGETTDPLLGIAAPTVAAGIAGLQAADPGFAVSVFMGRVQTAFMTLQDAWCRQNLETGRAFLSPGAYFGWRAQLDTMAAEGRRDVMEGLRIDRIEPIRVIHGRVFDDLTVRINAAAADFEVDGAGRIVFGDRSVRPFVEDWTFQRSVGTATTGKPGTLENTCPGCGAPLVLTQIGECRYCKAAVTSGKFDWVVSRIEQEDDGPGGSGNAGGYGGGAGGDLGTQIAAQIGGAVIGGLLGSLLSGGSGGGGDSDRW